MKPILTCCAALVILPLASSTWADLPAAKPASEADCDTGRPARALLLQGENPAPAEAKVRVEIRKEQAVENDPAKVAGRAVIVGPDGKRQEFSFGNPAGKSIRKRVKDGGAHLELKVAPNREALDQLKDELEETFEDHGIGDELANKVLDTLKNLDRLADLRVRGLAVGPEQQTEEFELRLGKEAGSATRGIDEQMEDGGAQFELGLETTEYGNDLLGMLLHAPESLKLLEESLRNPETIKLLNEIVSNPDLMEFFESAAENPEMLGALRKGLEDPLISGLLGKGLNNDGTAGLLKLFGGAAKPAPEQAQPAPEDVPAESLAPQEQNSSDAEVEQLRRELASQRALLEQILRKLDR